MNRIENTNSSNEKILNLYNQIHSGIINLAPDFQRKLVWNDTHKENFLDTILKGYPFPEIYIADGEIDLDNPTKIVKWVVDGQQRLNTIVQYIDNDTDLKLKKIPRFTELTDDEKKQFYYYNVVIRNLGKLNEDDIKEVFRRINSVNYALNAIEITNALYDGEFISTANTILDDNKKILEKLDIFSVNETSRMRDLEFILTLMSIDEEQGYFTTTQRNEFYIKEYNNEYPNKDKIITKFNGVFGLIDKIVDDSYSIWAKKSNFLTLFIELIRFAKNNTVNTEILKKVLTNFDTNLRNSKIKEDKTDKFYQYYFASIQGTGSKSARITRGKILQEFMTQEYDKLQNKKNRK